MPSWCRSCLQVLKCQRDGSWGNSCFIYSVCFTPTWRALFSSKYGWCCWKFCDKELSTCLISEGWLFHTPLSFRLSTNLSWSLSRKLRLAIYTACSLFLSTMLSGTAAIILPDCRSLCSHRWLRISRLKIWVEIVGELTRRVLDLLIGLFQEQEPLHLKRTQFECWADCFWCCLWVEFRRTGRIYSHWRKLRHREDQRTQSVELVILTYLCSLPFLQFAPKYHSLLTHHTQNQWNHPLFSIIWSELSHQDSSLSSLISSSWKSNSKMVDLWSQRENLLQLRIYQGWLFFW